jgi:hypothetical protein
MHSVGSSPRAQKLLMDGRGAGTAKDGTQVSFIWIGGG